MEPIWQSVTRLVIWPIVKRNIQVSFSSSDLRTIVMCKVWNSKHLKTGLPCPPLRNCLLHKCSWKLIFFGRGIFLLLTIYLQLVKSNFADVAHRSRVSEWAVRLITPATTTNFKTFTKSHKTQTSLIGFMSGINAPQWASRKKVLVDSVAQQIRTVLTISLKFSPIFELARKQGKV